MSRSFYHGLVLIDKEPGWTSHDVVQRARKVFRTSAVGHAGTLDPLASGLLVLMVGQATKLSDFLLQQNKQYEMTLQLGIETDTLDRTGQVLKKASVDSSYEEIRDTALALEGTFQWPVPKFSAVKSQGKKLYELARNNKEVPVINKEMSFWGLEVIGYDNNQAKLQLRFSCSKGSYVRSWAQQLGERLGCGATVDELRRLESAPYGVDQAITMPQLEEMDWGAESRAELPETAVWMIPLPQILKDAPSVEVSGKNERLMRSGQIPDKVRVELRVNPRYRSAKIVRVVGDDGGDLISLLQANERGRFEIRRVFPRE